SPSVPDPAGVGVRAPIGGRLRLPVLEPAARRQDGAADLGRHRSGGLLPLWHAQEPRRPRSGRGAGTGVRRPSGPGAADAGRPVADGRPQELICGSFGKSRGPGAIPGLSLFRDLPYRLAQNLADVAELVDALDL